LGISAETLIRFERLVPLAESALNAPRAGFGDTEAYPEFPTKAAVLCSRLVRNHPLPDGNKRVAYLSLREFVERNGYGWTSAGVDETVEILERLAARDLTEEELVEWVQQRLA